jgi:hypothetical protein
VQAAVDLEDSPAVAVPNLISLIALIFRCSVRNGRLMKDSSKNSLGLIPKLFYPNRDTRHVKERLINCDLTFPVDDQAAKFASEGKKV